MQRRITMKKILLVEDDALLNKTLTYNLISEGYDITSALDADTAAKLLTQTEYDLALLDINLPDGSGYDLCGPSPFPLEPCCGKYELCSLCWNTGDWQKIFMMTAGCS